MRVLAILNTISSLVAFASLAAAGPVLTISRDVLLYANELNTVAESGSVTPRDLEILDEPKPRPLESVPEEPNGLEPFNIETRTLSLPPTVWQLKPYKTFMQITITQVAASSQVQQLLHGAAGTINSHLQQFGPDTSLQSEFIYYLTPQLALQMWNWNHHEIKWQVATEAVAVLYDFMANRGFGRATFTIYAMLDGKGAVAVGKGAIGSVH